jgi:hypothetical protein
VYTRHVDSSSLGSSLSSHRQSYIGLVFTSRVIDLIINTITPIVSSLVLFPPRSRFLPKGHKLGVGDGEVFHTPCVDFSSPVEELEYTCLLKCTFTDFKK